jgi:hypothetical protein
MMLELILVWSDFCYGCDVIFCYDFYYDTLCAIGTFLCDVYYSGDLECGLLLYLAGPAQQVKQHGASPLQNELG